MEKRWYRANVTKAVLIIVAHLMIMIMTASFLWILSYPVFREELFKGKKAESYEDTTYFTEQMQNYSHYVLETLGTKKLFEADGKYDPNRIVDIQTFYNSGEISGENTSGLAYRLGDLVSWYDAVDTDGVSATESGEPVIVCKKEDGTYHYYRLTEFYDLFKGGEYEFVANDPDSHFTTDEILSDLEKGYSFPEGMYRGIRNKTGEIVYSDCWVFDGYPSGENIQELYAPIGEEDILAVVNNNKKWNGKLDAAYTMLDNAVRSIGSRYHDYYDSDDSMQEGNTNYTYVYANNEDKSVYTNKEVYRSYDTLTATLENIRQSGKYVIVRPKLADFETNLEDADAGAWKNYVSYFDKELDDFVFAAVIDTDYPIQDEIYNENEMFEKYGAGARSVAAVGFGAGIIFLACVLWLVITAGKNTRDDELHLNAFDRWKTEIGAVFVIAFWMVPTLMFISGFEEMAGLSRDTGQTIVTQYDYVRNSMPYIIGSCGIAAFTCMMFLTGLLSLVRRIKAKIVWKNSLLRALVKFIQMVFLHLNCVWKTVVLFGGFALVHWIVFFSCILPNEGFAAVLLIVEAAAFVYLVYSAVGKDRIKKGITKISVGELEYKVPLEQLKWEQREIAEKINSIGDGLEAAVEKSVRSERLKTDLITNVSHDIKTPLTSIINYVELLKQEDFEDPKIRHYIEVLEQKAQRLKNLTEDVVEASKVSSGNITLEYMNLNLNEMLQQISGETQERFCRRELTEVMDLPDREVLIRADGRRTWRIFENVYNNAAKYAMPGTRVYARLAVEEEQAVFTLKNISEQPLNIPAEELTERFIRGDIARSTEGSGLGLSIARTLAEMQGGKFELYLDGDLFKVTVKFPLVQKNESEL